MSKDKKNKHMEGNEEFFPNGDSKIMLHLSHELEKEESTITINWLKKCAKGLKVFVQKWIYLNQKLNKMLVN